MERRSFITSGMLVLIAGMLLILILPDQTGGDTITVADDGSGDFMTIQDGINNASAGDTVRVYEGRFFEHIIVNRTISLIGNATGETIIDGDGTGIVVRVTAPDVVLMGFDAVRGGGNWNDVGILVEASNCSISGVACSGNDRDGIKVKGADNTLLIDVLTSSNENAGIILEGTTGSTLTGVQSSFNRGAGLTLTSGATGNTIRNSTISGNDRGIHFVGSEDNTIIRNVISGNTNWNIGLQSSGSISILENVLTEGNGTGIYIEESPQPTITGNDCSGSDEYGIWLYNSPGATITGNDCEGRSYGLFLDHQSHGAVVSGNTFSNTTGIGVSVVSSNNNSFTNNLVIGNPEGFHIAFSSGNEIHNCSIYGNREYGVWASVNYDYTVNATGNWWGTGNGPYHETANPNGTGDEVSDRVIFDPWTGGDDLPPTARIISVYPDPALFHEKIIFSGMGEPVGTGDIIRYAWRSSIDGEFSNGTEATVEVDPLSPGNHTIHFKVLDSSGIWSEEVEGTANVTENRRPTVIITQPVANDEINGALMTISGHAEDPDGVGINLVEVYVGNSPMTIAAGTERWALSYTAIGFDTNEILVISARSFDGVRYSEFFEIRVVMNITRVLQDEDADLQLADYCCGMLVITPMTLFMIIGRRERIRIPPEQASQLRLLRSYPKE